MAIFYCCLRKFSRSGGYSAVGVAGYRAGEVLTDEGKGCKVAYQNKAATLIDKFIMLPEGADSKFYDREYFWNEAEKAENRRNSCVAREVQVALVHELDPQERIKSAVQMAQWLVARYHTAIDVTIHRASEEAACENYHAHLLFPTRALNKSKLGKKLRVLDDLARGREEVRAMRQAWEEINNSLLEEAGLAVRVDHRSLKDQGIDRLPQRKRWKNRGEPEGSLLT